MTTNNIYKIIADEVQDFKQNPALVIEGFVRNQKEVIEKIIRLYNSKFKDGEFDSEGFRKYFKNIVKNPCNSSTKAIKFLPADIMIIPAAGQDDLKAWIMDRDFKYWMKEKQFAKILNRMFMDLPIFGSVVLKLVGDNLHFVDLRNLINEQAADKLKDASYTIEQHYYSLDEMRKKPWDNIEEAVKMWRETKRPYVRVLERYGEVPESEFGGDENKYTYARHIVYMPDTRYMDRIETNTKGIILDATKIKRDEFPYRDFHFEKIPGAWLGIGRVELLSDPQLRTNEITNLRVKSSYVAGLNIWQTRDDNVKKNLIKDVKTGQVITAMDRIEKVPTEERNLSAFIEEERSWAGNADQVAFNYDVIRGERMPAGTPLGSAQLAAQMITSYFEHIRENIASDVKELIFNDIIPLFKKTGEHYIRLVGEDLDKWHQLKTNARANLELFKFLVQKKTIPTSIQFDVMKSVIKDKVKASKDSPLIPAEFYKDLKYSLDIVITGQERDLRVEAANMAMILQTMVADPTVLTDPVKRKIFSKQLEAVGISINDIEPEEAQSQQTPIEKRTQQGGGISAPSMPQVMQPGL